MSGRENMGRIRKMEVTKGWNYKKSTYSAGGLDSKESVCIAGDLGSTPGSGRSLGERNGNPLQYSCLEHSMDRGAWQVIIHRVAESDTTEHVCTAQQNQSYSPEVWIWC